MLLLDNIFEVVKSQLTIHDVAKYYGLEVNRGGFASCPFHVEKSSSFKLYENTNRYYCFGCGESGDVINLVGRLFNLSPTHAAEKLAQDFGVVVDNRVYDRKASIKAKMKSYDYEIKERRAYRLLSDYCSYLKQCRRNYAPTNCDERPNPLFMQSLSELDKFVHYTETFITGTKDEKIAFMKDFANVLSVIEKTLGKEQTVQVVLT
jgi:hypothetical protein